MKFLSVLLSFLMLILTSCSDSTGPGDSGDGDILASENIGSAGGTLSSDVLELTVPAGAFGAESSIAVTTAPDHPFEEDAVSDTYVIAGLPQSYTRDITVSIPFTGELSDNSYIAVGMNTWVKSLGEMTTTYALLPATVDGETITAELPASGLLPAKSATKSANESSSLSVTAVTGYAPHVTAGGHFKIEYASRWTSLSSVQELGRYLEEAYTTIANLGFSYDERTNWPVSVTVKSLDKDVYGFATNSVWGDNYGYLEFNSLNMNDLPEMRTTAGHEFFHLVQALYDPRNSYSKADSGGPHYWLDEATAVWIEEKFTDTQDYVSPVRAGNNIAPFNGVVAGAADIPDKHGYGLSAMIKHLADEYGESCIAKMYEALKSGSDPMTSVSSGTTSPIEWWEEFLRNYTCGDIYNVTINELTANNNGMFRAITNSDTLATFTDEYPDVSGGLYIIRLENNNFNENSVLSLSVEGDMAEVTAIKYRLKPLGVEFLGTNTDKVTVSDLKSLADDGWHIIALVSNSRAIPPYTDTSTIKLTARISTPINPGFNYFSLRPELIGDFEYSYQDDATTLFYPSFSPSGPGTLEGTTFTGTRNEPWGTGTIVGNYTIVFDDTFQNILSIEATQSKTTPGDEDEGTSYHNVTFTARDIPLSWIDDGVYVYQLVGNRITDQITSMTFEYGITNDRWARLVDYRGGSGTSIIIRIWKK